MQISQGKFISNITMGHAIVPSFNWKKQRLWPYMVMWISTGNERNLCKSPFKLEFAEYIQTKTKKANKKTTPSFIKTCFNQSVINKIFKIMQISQGKHMSNITIGHAIVPIWTENSKAMTIYGNVDFNRKWTIFVQKSF